MILIYDLYVVDLFESMQVEAMEENIGHDFMVWVCPLPQDVVTLFKNSQASCASFITITRL